jgi:AhpD family alkylhydroperoxidase
MEQRIQIDEIEPGAYDAMFALEKYLAGGILTDAFKDIIKIRASQINGCGFCIDMHTKEALKHGEDPQRIFLLDAWKETDVFTEEEKVLLQITEEVTLVHNQGLQTETYAKALKLFSENQICQIIMTIVTINAWNRIAIATKKPF